MDDWNNGMLEKWNNGICEFVAKFTKPLNF